MSRSITSNDIHSVTVVDGFVTPVKVYAFKAYDFAPESENIDMWTEQITLFQNSTARTNVMIRGRDGKFISYKNVPELFDAVLSLKPFPFGE